MPDPASWDEEIGTDMLETPIAALTEQQMATLWSMFTAIPKHWELEVPVDLLRSRWLDMIEALSASKPDYRAEYANAVSVYDAMLDKLGADAATKLLFTDTKITKPADAKTRLSHAKFYVANDFIRCFVATGGFRGFVKQARNYTGFMGGSRFREWAPVRTGARK